MKEIRVGDMYACFESVMSIGRQEMDIATAERIADFTDAFLNTIRPLDVRRSEMLAAEYETPEQRLAVFDDFANEKAELPEFSFKEFGHLRITPEGLSALKRAGLYT